MRFPVVIGIIVLVLVLLVAVIRAKEVQFVTQANVLDVTVIEDVSKQNIYYGTLTSLPHMYSFTITAEALVVLALEVPDSPAAEINTDIIMLRDLGNDRGVEEVTRLTANQASWEAYYDFATGDSYLSGPQYQATLPPGTYYVEVSTPINETQYVLKVGYEEGEQVGYLSRVQQIARIKEFFGKGQWAILQSPYGYIPLLLLLGVSGIVIQRRNRIITNNGDV